MRRHSFGRSVPRVWMWGVLSIGGASGCEEPPESEFDSELRTHVVEVMPGEDGAGDVLYRMTNTTEEAWTVAIRETALEGVGDDLFRIEHDGRGVRFRLPHFFYVDPTGPLFTIAPESSVEVSVDLTDAYDMSEPGVYTVRLRNPGASDASPIEVTVDASHASRPLVVPEFDDPSEGPLEDGAKLGTITDCSRSERSALLNGQVVAEDLMDAGIGYLGGAMEGIGPDEHIDRWFGTTLPGRYAVYSRLIDMSDIYQRPYRCRDAGDLFYRLPNGRDRGCEGPGIEEPVFASTAGFFGDTVHACPSLISLNTRRRAAVMAHEESHHFGTGDPVNGSNAAENLAASDPDAARLSAANYEFYLLEF